MTNINNIPKHWQVKKLGELAKVKGGKRLPKGELYSDTITSYPYIRVTDFDNQTINTNKLKYLKEGTHKDIKNYKISKEDVYISIAGTIGVTGTIPINLDGANLTENAAKITELKDCYNKYISLFLSSNKGQSQITEYTKTTTQPKLSLYRIEQLEIPIPPLPEQHAIVSKIEELLSDLENGKQQLLTAQEQLKVYRQSLLKAAFEGKLTNNDVKEDELPKGWHKVQLVVTAEFINGDRGRNYPNRNEYVTDGIPFINTGHIMPNGKLDMNSMNYISREKYNNLNSGKIKYGDLIYCLRGATMGKTAIIDQFEEGAIASSLVIVRTNNNVHNRYVYYYLTSPLGKDFIKKYDNGTAQPNLSAKSLSMFLFPLPSLEEQQLIVSELESRLTVCDKLEEAIGQSLQKAETLRQSILKKAFEGRLVG